MDAVTPLPSIEMRIKHPAMDADMLRQKCQFGAWKESSVEPGGGAQTLAHLINKVN